MAKLIEKYNAEYVSVKKLDGSEYSNLDFRAWSVGFTGEMSLMESEDKAPGKKFIRFQYGGINEYITTSYGELEENDDILILRTKNSIYEFRKI